MNRFNMNLSGLDHSNHYFDWKPDSIVFKSTWGAESCSWKYSNSTYIPRPGNENLRINLHLFNASAPLNHQDAELILNSFVTGIGSTGIPGENATIFPNPTEKGCIIDIRSEVLQDIEIGLTDLQGTMFRKLLSGKLTPGNNRIEWNGNTMNGNPVPRGLYILSIKDKTNTHFFKILKN